MFCSFGRRNFSLSIYLTLNGKFKHSSQNKHLNLQSNLISNRTEWIDNKTIDELSSSMSLSPFGNLSSFSFAALTLISFNFLVGSNHFSSVDSLCRSIELNSSSSVIELGVNLSFACRCECDAQSIFISLRSLQFSNHLVCDRRSKKSEREQKKKFDIVELISYHIRRRLFQCQEFHTRSHQPSEFNKKAIFQTTKKTSEWRGKLKTSPISKRVQLETSNDDVDDDTWRRERDANTLLATRFAFLCAHSIPFSNTESTNFQTSTNRRSDDN